MTDRIREKLQILADAAKYDVSCSSSGSNRKNKGKGLGNTGNGICHSYTEDGRCVSLLKILFSNVCIFDCCTVFLDALMMSNEPRLPYKKWWI